MQLINKVKTLAVGLYDEIILHWNKPAAGNSIPYKEYLNYSLGGMGQRMVTYLLGYMALSATNTLLGSTIGIRPMHLQYMSIIATILGIFVAVLRGKWVDNTRTRFGRFRPYIALMGFPLVGMSLIFLFLPFRFIEHGFVIVNTSGEVVYLSFLIHCAMVVDGSCLWGCRRRRFRRISCRTPG